MYTQWNVIVFEKKDPAFVTTWTKQEVIMLSEGNQMEKDKYCRISLTCGILKKKKKT